MKISQTKLTLTPLRAAMLIAATLQFGSAFAQSAGASKSPALAGTDQAQSLADGAEIFENLTESASALDEVEFNKALSEYEKLSPEIFPHLSPERKTRLETLMRGVHEDWQKKDRGAMAIQSIEVYRLLQESIIDHGQSVPKEVSLLDYAGFKLNGLLLSPQPDWKEVAKTTQEASAWWTAIKPRITDKNLRDAMDHTIRGINDAAARKDTNLLRFAANMDLILVDGMEAFFESSH